MQAADDLSEPAQFEYIAQTVGHHLENYLKYNRKEKSDLEMFMKSKKSGGLAQKHMEVVSLGCLISLRAKSHNLCMGAIMELPRN